MDVSNTTIIFTHLFIAWTLFGVLLVWIVLFTFLALHSEAESRGEEVEETSSSASLTKVGVPPTSHTSIAQPSTLSPANAHSYENTGSVEVAPLV
ncbi:MAG: hypothetical protein NVS4B11_23540 [Ktedonobacteraceae bacterium]